MNLTPIKNILRELLKLDPKYRHRKISYSQYGEDLIIYKIFREYLSIDNPSYIDIGAHHPFHLSNSALFYKLGSTGLNIEANPVLIKAFYKYRPKDKNLNVGISVKNETLPFYIMEQPELNTFVKEQAETLDRKGYPIKCVLDIPCYTLEYIIQKYCNGIFPDFMSLDVEGLDESIIENYTFKESRPKIICVENLKMNKNNGFYKIEKIRKLLNYNNYVLIADTFLNDIFVNNQLINYLPENAISSY